MKTYNINIYRHFYNYTTVTVRAQDLEAAVEDLNNKLSKGELLVPEEQWSGPVLTSTEVDDVFVDDGKEE